MVTRHGGKDEFGVAGGRKHMPNNSFSPDFVEQPWHKSDKERIWHGEISSDDQNTNNDQINPSGYGKRAVLRQEPLRSKYSLLSSTQAVRIKKRAEFPRAD